MKGKSLLILLILGLFFGTVSVRASNEGEAWTPDDHFLTEHMEACLEEKREYYANGPNGQATIYESPASSKVISTLENGAIVRIDYVFTNDAGVTWGLCEFEGEFGWVPMPYMVVVYDYISFEEEYGDQFQVEIDFIINLHKDFELFKEFTNLIRRSVKFWTYPGSSDMITLVVYDNDVVNLPRYSKIFIDEDGLKWGFVSSYSGKTLNRWVCLAVGNKMFADFDELYPDGAPIRDKRVIEAYSGEEIFPEDYEEVQRMQKIKMVAAATGIVVFVSALVLFYWKMWKKVKQL